jgi:hypothetical protein
VREVVRVKLIGELKPNIDIEKAVCKAAEIAAIFLVGFLKNNYMNRANTSKYFLSGENDFQGSSFMAWRFWFNNYLHVTAKNVKKIY